MCTFGLAAALSAPLVLGQDHLPPDVHAQLADLQRQLAEQRRLIDELGRALAGRDRAAARTAGQDALASEATVAPELALPLLAQQGKQVPVEKGRPAPSPDKRAPQPPKKAPPPARPPPAPYVDSSRMLADYRGRGGDVTAAAAATAAAAVGKPPASDGRPPEVAPLFEQPGVLTPRGKLVLEPGFQFGYSSSNRVALVGYTVIPALLIGLVDVREVKRNTSTALFSARMGLTNRVEVETKIPYVYRSDATVSREIFTGTAVENVFSTSGKHLGDIEVGARYQLNGGAPDRAYYIASLRLKSRTGRDPFEVVTDCNQRCVGPNASGTGLPLDLPTGSGFYSVQPGLTWLFPSDPAVFFGSLSYLHNIRRKNVSRLVLGGEREFLGEVAPGDVIGFNFGMGLGLNEKASLSLGYDHSAIGRTRQAGQPVPGSVRTQLGTLLLGFSYRMSERRSVNVSVGAGLTRDTPDVSLTIRMPTTF